MTAWENYLKEGERCQREWQQEQERNRLRRAKLKTERPKRNRRANYFRRVLDDGCVLIELAPLSRGNSGPKPERSPAA